MVGHRIEVIMLSCNALKGILIVSLLVVTFVVGFLPAKLTSFAARQQNPRWQRLHYLVLSTMSCFAAGVFLGACMLHLLTDTRDLLDKALETAGVTPSFPVVEFIVVLGFFLVLITEQIVLALKSKKVERRTNTSYGTFDSQGSRSMQSASGDNFAPSRVVGYSSPAVLSDREDERGLLTDSDRENSVDLRRMLSTESTGSQTGEESVHALRAMVMLLALSLHSIFEGIAIGLQKTNVQVLEIFAPIIIHKLVIAFSLGMRLVSSSLALWAVYLSVLIFSLTAPIGIGIGMAVIDASSNELVTNFVTGILQGLACGTFLFVVFIEILPHEFMLHKPEQPDRMIKVLCLLLGYSLMVLLVFVTPDNDD